MAINFLEIVCVLKVIVFAQNQQSCIKIAPSIQFLSTRSKRSVVEY